MITNRVLWHSLLVAPAIVASALIGSMPAQAAQSAIESESTIAGTVAPAAQIPAVAAPIQVASTPVNLDLNQLQQYSAEGAGDAVEQVTNVSQLSDVRPTDWAFQALSRLISNYGCIAGYPDGTYRGNRALTRYEFAAGLNACLDAISERIGTGVKPEDLAELRRLQEEFRAELASIRGAVDALEARTAELEANQFSTTTKLVGETIFSMADVFGGEETSEGNVGDDNNFVFQYRVRLNFDTSFTGRDRLRARLQSGNFIRFTEPGNGETRLGYEGANSNNVVLDALSYQFPVTNRATVALFGNAGSLDDLTFGNTINPLDGAARAAVSRFGQRNAIYRSASTNAGAGVNFLLTNPELTTNRLSLQLGYLAGTANDPAPGRGLFAGNYGLLAQLTGRNLLNGNLDLAFTYINGYQRSGGVPWGVGSNLARVNVGRPLSTNSYGVQANYRLSSAFQIGGWAGFTAVRAIGRGDADVWNYGLTLGFPNLGKEGNLLGIVAGIQPRLTGADASLTVGARGLDRRRDPDTGLHLEAFYRYALTDNIDITPAIIWLTAPDHNSDNDDIFVGVLRTTFRF
jgi:hypothetical protein